MTLLLTSLRPFLPYLIGLALVASAVGGAYLKGRHDVNERWAAQVAADKYAARLKQLDTDEAVRTADAARADKAEQDLKSYKAKAEANAKALKNPSRVCFDADDTRRVQRLFER